LVTGVLLTEGYLKCDDQREARYDSEKCGPTGKFFVHHVEEEKSWRKR
jgi:hypothetical protein